MSEAKSHPSESATVESPGHSDAHTDSDDEETLSKDDVFHILQNERRRRVLELISCGDPTFNMRDVAEQVAAWEHDTTVQALKSDERQRVYIALYQSHLPKLDKLGVIDYNQSRGIIERKPLIENVEPYLDTATNEGNEDSGVDDSQDEGVRNHSFAVAAFVSLFLIGISWVGLFSSFMVSDLVLATAVTGMFMISGFESYFDG